MLGSMLGFSSFVAAPLVLSKVDVLQGGKGIAIGLVLGSMSAIGSTFTGIVFGLGQIFVGIMNTPGAIFAVWFEGKFWDTDLRKWTYCYLEEEFENLLNSTNHPESVGDTTYYDLLGIRPGATSKEIKRGYHTKAKHTHPDKNPGDEEAAEQFVKIHKAYQTLMDPDQREAYDSFGTSRSAGSEDEVIFNVGVFFEILFGSQLVDSYIGQLSITSVVAQLMKLSQAGSASNFTLSSIQLLQESSRSRQRQRPIQVALHLRDKILPLVNQSASEDEFRASCWQEATAIAETEFGDTFLLLIGRALLVESDIYLQQKSFFSWPSWMVSTIRKKELKIRANIDMTTAVYRFVSELYHGVHNTTETSNPERQNNRAAFASSSQKEESKSKKSKKIPVELAEELLPQILDISWAYNAQDVAHVLQHACHKLFNDASASSQVITLRRAEAIHILGEIFVERSLQLHQNDNSSTPLKNDTGVDDKSDANARLQVAYRVARMQSDLPSREESEELIRRAKQNY